MKSSVNDIQYISVIQAVPGNVSGRQIFAISVHVLLSNILHGTSLYYGHEDTKEFYIDGSIGHRNNVTLFAVNYSLVGRMISSAGKSGIVSPSVRYEQYARGKRNGKRSCIAFLSECP